jgi:hypothetical protein
MRGKIYPGIGIALAVATVASAEEKVSSAAAWAGCAGALALKAQRDGGAAAASIGSLARRALAQAKRADNPTNLTPQQLDSTAMAAASRYREELAKDPSRIPAFEKAAATCIDGVEKLPS